MTPSLVSRLRARFASLCTSIADSHTTCVRLDQHKFFYYTPSKLSYWRAISSPSKEPCTLDWIQSFSSSETFWDVGANVGVYTLYALKVAGCKVVAFEPQPSNFNLLIKNILLNDMQDTCIALPVPLHDTSSIAPLSMCNLSSGTALATFGNEQLDYTGAKSSNSLFFNTISLSPFQLLDIGLPHPTHIKIDVDGNEHIILQSLKPYLHKVKSVLLETNKSYSNQYSSILDSFTSCRFSLSYEEPVLGSGHTDSNYNSLFNQIWINDSATI